MMHTHTITGVVRDHASKHQESWAVIVAGALLPVRFSRHPEAAWHLRQIEAGTCDPYPGESDNAPSEAVA